MVAADEENVHDNPAAEPLHEPAAVAEETPMETPPGSRWGSPPDGGFPPMGTPPRWRLPPEFHDRIARRAPRAVVTEGPLNANRVLACSCSRLAWLSPMTVDSGAMRAF